jgi:hypothetical protein
VGHIISEVEAGNLADSTFTFAIASSASVARSPKRLVGEVCKSAVTYVVTVGQTHNDAGCETYRGPELPAAIAAYNAAP